MPAFRRRKGNLPRFLPELDDVALGQVRQRLETSWSRGSLDTSVIALVANVIEAAGQDWDRKAHRLEVLAGAAGRAVPDIWRRNSPRDQGALLLHAWSDLLQAQRGASVDLTATRDTCHLAADLLPADPTPWTLALATLRLERRPHREMSAIWREIKARDPWNREAHLQALGYLSPDECGSTALMLDLLDGIRSVMPADAPTAGLEITTLVRNYHRSFAADGLTALGAGEHWRRPDLARALDQAAQDWPNPDFLTHAAAIADLNVLAYALIKATRSNEATAVLRATKGLGTPWPWNVEGDPLERFSHWYGRV
ncbi:hypothetical protein AB0I10_15520 [Streptomyces sp. NPDC050636]|uniref:hypothetical protein n=1 Tax=Streptomyces sp. NPDC050636 TaxID=3154510 RepID=UPI003438BBBF